MMDATETPWTRGDLLITRAALSEIERLAIAGYRAESEVCGVLAGPASEPRLCDRVVPIENLAGALHERDPVAFPNSARTFFVFHERTLATAIREGEQRGSPVKVLYHSHLDVDAELSGADQALLSRGTDANATGSANALGPGPAWPLAFLVTSVRATPGGVTCDAHRLWVWANERFEESAFQVL
jgi:[CysO sulfur-carrier protein]-S-L-cysteine hydrolase